MENTLHVGDRVLVNKLVYHIRDIQRGDVVVFNGVDSWDREVQIEEPSNPVAAFCRWVGTAVRRRCPARRTTSSGSSASPATT